MSGTEPGNRLFPSTQHVIAGQIAALRLSRNSMVIGMSAIECRRVLDEQIAELEARLSLNASAGTAVVLPYQAEGLPGGKAVA